MKRKHTGLWGIIIILVLCAAIYFLFAFKEKVYTGNTYVTEKELDRALMKKPYDENTLLFLLDRKIHPSLLPEGVKKVDIRLLRPWRIGIHVTEEKPLAQIRDVDGKYAVFSEKGQILYMAGGREKGICVIEGISVTDQPRKGKKVVSKDDRFFEKMTHLVRGLEKSGLAPDEIIYKKDSYELTFNAITVKMGSGFYTEKTEMLPGILEKLKGRAGVLDLSEQSSNPKYVSFRPDKEEENPETAEAGDKEKEDIVSSQ